MTSGALLDPHYRQNVPGTRLRRAPSSFATTLHSSASHGRLKGPASGAALPHPDCLHRPQHADRCGQTDAARNSKPATNDRTCAT
ncbi:hypothetical protein BD310DRAFT_926856, partial [Dichomitus squalens]